MEIKIMEARPSSRWDQGQGEVRGLGVGGLRGLGFFESFRLGFGGCRRLQGDMSHN